MLTRGVAEIKSPESVRVSMAPDAGQDDVASPLYPLGSGGKNVRSIDSGPFRNPR
jgi:hypothetical protein